MKKQAIHNSTLKVNQLTSLTAQGYETILQACSKL